MRKKLTVTLRKNYIKVSIKYVTRYFVKELSVNNNQNIIYILRKLQANKGDNAFYSCTVILPIITA